MAVCFGVANYSKLNVSYKMIYNTGMHPLFRPLQETELVKLLPQIRRQGQ